MDFQNSHPKNCYTTYRHDYIPIKGTFKKREKTISKPTDIKENIIPKPQQIDISSLTPFKDDVYVPFNLFHRPKEIIQTNPYDDIAKPKSDKFFEERLKVRKIRPRVVMMPQIALDDIDEELMYKGDKPLAEYIYSSQWKDDVKFCVQHAFPKYQFKKKIANFSHKNIIERSYDLTSFKAENHIPSMRLDLRHKIKKWSEDQPILWIDFKKKNREKVSPEGVPIATTCDETDDLMKLCCKKD